MECVLSPCLSLRPTWPVRPKTGQLVVLSGGLSGRNCPPPHILFFHPKRVKLPRGCAKAQVSDPGPAEHPLEEYRYHRYITQMFDSIYWIRWFPLPSLIHDLRYRIVRCGHLCRRAQSQRTSTRRFFSPIGMSNLVWKSHTRRWILPSSGDHLFPPKHNPTCWQFSPLFSSPFPNIRKIPCMNNQTLYSHRTESVLFWSKHSWWTPIWPHPLIQAKGWVIPVFYGFLATFFKPPEFFRPRVLSFLWGYCVATPVPCVNMRHKKGCPKLNPPRISRPISRPQVPSCPIICSLGCLNIHSAAHSPVPIHIVGPLRIRTPPPLTLLS